MILKGLVNGMEGIVPGGISVKDFSVVAQISQNEAQRIINELAKNSIGKIQDDGTINFIDGDKLRSALFAIKQGASIGEVSEHLGWRDFEGLVSEVLASKHFGTIRNLVLTQPRMEIDVVGIRLGVAILIDCKHWKKSSTAALAGAVKKQIQRTKHYVAKTPGAIAAPCIVTLYQDRINFINRVPIIPIFQFSSFVDDFYGNLDELETIKAKST